jgi:hypothetical protein
MVVSPWKRLDSEFHFGPGAAGRTSIRAGKGDETGMRMLAENFCVSV